MKNKSIISLLAFLFGVSVTTTSCEDMLTPDMGRNVEEFNGKDTVNFYLGILRNLQGVVEQNVILGEIRGDLATTTSYTSDSISGIANFETLQDGDNALLNRAAYYKVINQCNFYLAKVDTMAKSNNSFYMRKEAGQVRTIRAWTYMQLVQNYGTVPFFTKPVDNANTGWETNSPEGDISVENILQKLSQDLETSIAYEDNDEYGLPNYGSFSTGKSGLSIAHRSMLFPARLVLADIYLLTAKNTADYEKAATLYYEYLNPNKNSSAPYVTLTSAATYMKSFSTVGGKETYTVYPALWVSGLSYLSSSEYNSYSAYTELRTVVPSAANSSFGKVLTRIPQIYGFDPHSSNTTDTEENDEGESVSSTSGEVTITANYKNRQIAPSNSYINLNTSQIYSYTSGSVDNREIDYPEDLGDARLVGTAPLVRTDEGYLRFIQKFGGASAYSNGTPLSGTFTFRYVIPVYRTRQIYLRFAEALNRAGHPRYAFAILRNGLAKDLLPTVATDTVNTEYELVPDEEDNSGNPVYKLVSAQVKAYVDSIAQIGANYISVDAMLRAEGKPYLEFNDAWINAGGIHGLGSGDCQENVDTLYNYGVTVAKRMLDEEARIKGFDVKQYYKDNGIELDMNKVNDPSSSLSSELRGYITNLYTESNRQEAVLYEGNVVDELAKKVEVGARITPLPSEESLQMEINAVETLIADEMALETAFEGFRYYDLMRIARHKTAAGYSDGAQWLAWLIARRDTELAPYENVNDYGNRTLYDKLCNPSNWYLLSPQY